MKLTKENAQARAHKLETTILKLLETGEFTPDYGYFETDMRLGPCGCAIAAAAYSTGELVGANDNETYGIGWIHSNGLRRIVEDNGIATYEEARELEHTYESNVGMGDRTTPFGALGDRLRRFNPFNNGFVG